MNDKIQDIVSQIVKEGYKRKGLDLVGDVYAICMQIQTQIIAFMEKKREKERAKNDP